MEKRVTELVRKLNTSNIQSIADEIKNHQNLITGRGSFCHAVMKFQSGFPRSTDIYATLVATINSELPDVGLLLVKRVVLQFDEAYDYKDKKNMCSNSKFLAHLINLAVVYEVVVLNVMLLLLENLSLDNTEVAMRFCLECGRSLLCCAPRRTLNEIFREFKHVLKRRGLKKHVQVSIVRLLSARRSGFKRCQDISPETSLDDFEPKSGSYECEMMIGSRDSGEITSRGT